MLIAIIAAMKEETTFLISRLSNPSELYLFHYVFYKGKMGNHDVVIVQGGVGKTASGMLVTALMTQFPLVDVVINVGVAGGVAQKTQVGDIVISDKIIYGDVDLTEAGNYQFGQMSGCPRHFTSNSLVVKAIKKRSDCLFGDIISSDRFMVDRLASNDLINKYFSDYNVLCFDMESAAFAHACFVFKKPFLAIRAISDIVGDNLHDEFSKNLDVACLKSNLFMISVIENL
ncbi:MAG: 5'-methylthioadenosine/S-adenosylhomocysteine nucleosidase [Bacilli bacterium]